MPAVPGELCFLQQEYHSEPFQEAAEEALQVPLPVVKARRAGLTWILAVFKVKTIEYD